MGRKVDPNNIRGLETKVQKKYRKVRNPFAGQKQTGTGFRFPRKYDRKKMPDVYEEWDAEIDSALDELEAFYESERG